MSKAWAPCVALLACVGCATPSVTSRPVHSEASSFVRLDSFGDGSKSSDVQYDHPADWTEVDLSSILERLLVQERKGLMEETLPPQPLFSSEEVRQLAPQLQAAFRIARPSEWVAFYFSRPVGASLEITSGALFLKEGHLHVVIANPRARTSASPGGTEEIRANPIRSLGGRAIRLTFEPPRYALATQNNWMGSSAGPAASELILDHRAFLADARPTTPVPFVRTSIPAREIPSTEMVAPPPTLPQADASDAGDVVLKDQVSRLEQEVARLKQRLEEQAEEIAQLKRRLPESATSKQNQTKKKPPR